MLEALAAATTTPTGSGHLSDAYTVLGIVGILVGALLAIIAAVVVIKSRVDKETMASYKRNSEAQAAEIITLRDQVKEIPLLREQLRVLTEQVTNAAAVDALSEQVAKNHLQVMAAIGGRP